MILAKAGGREVIGMRVKSPRYNLILGYGFDFDNSI
jgi:hypothetical protein